MPNSTPVSRDHSPSTRLLAIITSVVVIAALYLGKDLVIPFALALLLSFLLTSPVTWLERVRIRRPFSVIIVLGIAFSLASGLIWLGLQQVSGIAKNLPQYRAHMVRKLETLRRPTDKGVLNLIQSLSQFTIDFDGQQSAGDAEALRGGATSRRERRGAEPVPVHIVRRDTGLLSSFSFGGASILHYAGLFAAVVILTLFMLLNRGHLRNRLLRLLGQGHLVLMTTALDEAAQRVSRYLLTQSLLNTSFGTLLGSGLWLIGVPYAPFWGVLAAFLRFIPYAGTLLAGGCPFLLSLAVLDGWSKPLMTIGLFIGIEAVTSGLLEPWLYATRTGISSLAILLSAAFWALLWGPIGLLVATPLTVCLAVLGRHIAPLNFLHVLLADEPVLTPEICYYQRLIALDEEEAAELAETFLKQKTLIELCDEVIIPALGLAEQDRHNNGLDESRVQFLHRSTTDLLEEFAERETSPATVSNLPASILCVPVRDEADELIATMVARILRKQGLNAESTALANVADLRRPSSSKVADVIILSALPPFAVLPARALCRQLRRFHPKVKIVLGFWNSAMPAQKIQDRLGPKCADALVTSVRETLGHLTALIAPGPVLPELAGDEGELVADAELHNVQHQRS